MPIFNLNVFHDYDVRAIYPTEINEDFFYHLGKAVALYIGKNKTIGVGYDGRTSSPSLSAKLIEGITDYGAHVVNLGLISTEIHYYAAGIFQYDANVIVTASHNPKEYNGMKMVIKGVIPLHGGFGLPEIKSFVNHDLPKADTKGTVTTQIVTDQFVEFCLNYFKVEAFKPLKVVVDTGNGVGGLSWGKVVGKLGTVELIPLFFDVDGTFPNHAPDPVKDQNLQQLISKVKETKADLGVAIDGDADRIFFIDNEGMKLSGGLTLALLARHFLSKDEKGTYVYSASIGRIAPETIKKLGGEAIKVRDGHAFFKEKLRETNGIFGGEHSGHYGYKDTFNAEFTLFFGLMMIDILSKAGVSLSDLRKEIDIYPESEEINFKNADVSAILDELKEVFKTEALDISDLDGTAFTFSDGWFIVRASKTEPLLRLNMDANTKEILNTRLSQVISLIEKHGGVRK